MSERPELIEKLRRVPLFGDCERGEINAIARHAMVTTSGSGVELVVQGEEGNALYILLDGTARVYRDGIAAADLGPGDHFGELALLDPGPRSATVVTTSEAEVAVLSGRVLRVLLGDSPQLCCALLAYLARRLRETGLTYSQDDGRRRAG